MRKILEKLVIPALLIGVIIPIGIIAYQQNRQNRELQRTEQTIAEIRSDLEQDHLKNIKALQEHLTSNTQEMYKLHARSLYDPNS